MTQIGHRGGRQFALHQNLYVYSITFSLHFRGGDSAVSELEAA
jgi:hypothetical protein